MPSCAEEEALFVINFVALFVDNILPRRSGRHASIHTYNRVNRVRSEPSLHHCLYEDSLYPSKHLVTSTFFRLATGWRQT